PSCRPSLYSLTIVRSGPLPWYTAGDCATTPELVHSGEGEENLENLESPRRPTSPQSLQFSKTA
ncbi:MAG: hypothetical protein OWU32_14030, partial [Firmicutes bacterium]|nr:hypothetical protein [Bacillota bacterium]